MDGNEQQDQSNTAEPKHHTPQSLTMNPTLPDANQHDQPSIYPMTIPEIDSSHHTSTELDLFYQCPQCGSHCHLLDFVNQLTNEYNPLCSMCMIRYHNNQFNDVHQLLAAQVVNDMATAAGIPLALPDLPPSIEYATHGPSEDKDKKTSNQLLFNDGSKSCRKCKEVLPNESFPLLKGKKRQLAAVCITCRSNRQNPASDTNRDENDQNGSGLGGDGVQYMPLVLRKKCVLCGEVKPAQSFRRTRNKTDHLQVRCKDCQKALERGIDQIPGQRRPIQVIKKHCIRCSTDKPFSDFFISNTSLDGLSTYCRACQTKASLESRKKRMIGIKNGDLEVVKKNTEPKIIPESKTCSLCCISKPSDSFYKSSGNGDGLYTYCKECSTERNTEAKRERRQKKKELEKLRQRVEEMEGAEQPDNNNHHQGDVTSLSEAQRSVENVRLGNISDQHNEYSNCSV